MQIKTRPATPEYLENWDRIFAGGRIFDIHVCCGTAMERPYSDSPMTCRHCGETRDDSGRLLSKGPYA